MTVSSSTRWFIEGVLVGFLAGGIGAGFFVYTGLFFLLLLMLMLFAVLHRDLKLKLRWWGFLAGAVPATIVSWCFILPKFDEVSPPATKATLAPGITADSNPDNPHSIP
jgi:hypothetical protein